MMIIKQSGERVRFDEKKLRVSLERTGAKRAMIDHVVSNIKKNMRDGMTTKELYRLVTRELKRENSHIAHRYHLRTGLLRLGPAGFKFEKYVAAILNAYQYTATNPTSEIDGLCVSHEVDVVAEKDGKRIVIEAKFRNRFGDDVDLKDTMATYARYLDLLDGGRAGKAPKFDELWIVTNGRFSDRASQFGICRDIRLVGWNEPEHSLARMVDHAALYPITVLDGLRTEELDNLADEGLMLCRQVADMKPDRVAKKVGMDAARAAKMVERCKLIVAG